MYGMKNTMITMADSPIRMPLLSRKRFWKKSGMVIELLDTWVYRRMRLATSSQLM